MDYYSVFGIGRKLALDPADLQKRFYQLSREVHPDRFAGRAPGERAEAEQKSALLNDAYRVLRDPLARTEYLLKLEGFDIGEQRSKDVPPELLEEVFELNMALEEVRMGDTDARQQVASLESHFAAMRDAIDREIATLAAAHDTAPSTATLQQIRSLLNRRRYIRNLIQEVDKVLAAGQPAA